MTKRNAKKPKIRHLVRLVKKPQQRSVVVRFLRTSKRALSYMRIEKALLFFETRLKSAVKFFLVVVKLKASRYQHWSCVTSFAKWTLKSSGTKTPITFVSKSALTSGIVLTRILNTIALKEKTNRCHCHYHYHHYNHFQQLIVNRTATIINIVIVILVIIVVLLFLYFSNNFEMLSLWGDSGEEHRLSITANVFKRGKETQVRS